MPEPTYQLQRSLSSTDNDFDQNNADPDGPIAEALIQNDKMFHNLKILKPAQSDILQSENHNPIDDIDQMTYRQPRKGVYSQVSISFNFTVHVLHIKLKAEKWEKSIFVQLNIFASSI